MTTMIAVVKPISIIATNEIIHKLPIDKLCIRKKTD